MTNRSEAYHFTTYDETDKRIAELKRYAKVTNAYRRAFEIEGKVTPSEHTFHDGSKIKGVKRLRVVVRGRLGKNNVYAPLYRKGGSLYRRCAQTIKNEHASRFDVYVQDSYVWRKA